ncbi:hypothetical protein JG688_00011503 [Phytophthora aleatoria]|uniref:Uncharacterized protein n=1 Tax=Phytophthora aleatoria TaxID=2496075 RepID=A0A8J5IK01_9STRA|nr:hypothetical protein JG688_00011503 [Phytophthora aleatoria]
MVNDTAFQKLKSGREACDAKSSKRSSNLCHSERHFEGLYEPTWTLANLDRSGRCLHRQHTAVPRRIDCSITDRICWSVFLLNKNWY